MKKALLGCITALLILVLVPSSAVADDEAMQKQKAVLITGASTGLGRAMAELLAPKGHFVYASARKDQDIAELSAIENIQGVSERLTDMVGSQQQAVEGVAADLQRTAEALGQAVETINRTFAQVETAISGERLVNIVASAERAALQIDSLTVELLQTSREMGAAAAAADTTLKSVGAVADAMLRGEGSLGLMLRDSAMYWRIVESNAEIQALLKDLRENPKKYINLRVF